MELSVIFTVQPCVSSHFPGDKSSRFCRVTFILWYCNLRSIKPGSLFCHADNTPITVNQFNTELRRCLNFCGLNPQRYKSHSFRKEFNFAWVRHGLPCILSVICRTFRSTQGLFYLIGGHARAAPWRVCSTL